MHFYRKLLVGFPRGGLVYDVGANAGEKTDVFLRLGARVLAVEPDELNQRIIREKFLEYRLRPKPVIIVGKAVSDSEGIETMWIDSPGSVLNTLSSKWVTALQAEDHRVGVTTDPLEFRGRRDIEATTLERLFRIHGRPFFLKIDVEGYEYNVLRSLRQPVPYLSFEVNLPEFLVEGKQCVNLLSGLHAGEFDYTANCRMGLSLHQWVGPQELSPSLSWTVRGQKRRGFLEDADFRR